MGEGFIVRNGGRSQEVLRTAVPSINAVESTNGFSYTFTNNEATEADIYFGVTSPPTNKITVAGNTTSPETVVPGLIAETEQTIFAYAIAIDPSLKKIKSEIVSTIVTTGVATFTAATGGTTLEYNASGKRYKSHTFTSNGTFQVTTVGNGDRNQVDYLIIAGGGSGGLAAGGAMNGGGGGAGGYLTTLGDTPGNLANQPKFIVTATNFEVVTGAGGSSGNGTNSSAFGITSVGGGSGTRNPSSNISRLGVDGGSGGGGGATQLNDSNASQGGKSIFGQGQNGGKGLHNANTNARINGGGGGGAGVVGGEAVQDFAGNGGNGLANLLRTGSNETRAGGGGGGNFFGGTNGTGGSGGGGAGKSEANTGFAGTANTGSGGGATNGNGGSGIVIIRYEIAPTT